MKPYNETSSYHMLLTEGSRVNEVWVYKVDGVATDISGGAFKLNLLDRQGGAIIDSFTVSYTTDGTDGSVTLVYEIADLDTVLAAYDAETGGLPSFWEMFFSSDGTAAKYKVWFNGKVSVDRSGS